MCEAKVTEKELNMSEKVEVFNIAPWDVAFNYVSGNSYAQFSPNGTQRITREEILNQIQNGNKLFNGIDGEGGHATLYIFDDALRAFVEFDRGKTKQYMINADNVKKLFALPYAKFVDTITTTIVTRAEKSYLIKLIRDLKINEYDKIMFCQDYCKFHL